MSIKKTVAAVLSGIISCSMLFAVNSPSAYAAEAITQKTIKRVQGLDRIKTALAVAEELTNEKLNNVVLAYAYNYPDALSGSTLSKKVGAPLLLVGTQKEDQDVFAYIYSNLSTGGNIYILGGTGVVGKDVEQTLSDKGYNVIRLAGDDRIGTCNAIINQMNVASGTPLFIAYDDGFADALSASGIAASHGYPILLSGKDTMDKLMKEQLVKIAPKNVYIVGGTGVISSAAEAEIKKIVPNAIVERLAGLDRYETSMEVYNHFYNGSTDIVLASGTDFPDALSGSMLAAKLNTSIVLADEQNLDVQQSAFDQKSIKGYYLLGGNGALSSNEEAAITFDKAKEEENIRASFTKAMNAMRLGEIDEYMSTVDENAPEYDATKEVMKQLFDFLAQNNLDIVPRIDTMDIVSINYREASVNTAETVALTDNNTKTTQYTTGHSSYDLRKINGQWKVHYSETY